jgi:hypothetical protein
VHTRAFVTSTNRSAVESTNKRHNVPCNQHSNSLSQTNRLKKKSKIIEQYRIAGDFLTKFSYLVSGRTRCRRRPNYRPIRSNFSPIRPNFAPTTAIFGQRRRLQSPARAEGEVSHGASVRPTPGGGNSLHVRRGPSGPILSYLIHFKM